MAVKNKIILKKFNWTKDKSAFVTGFSWLDNKYLTTQNFAEFISENSSSFEIFSQTVQLLNGQFSIIVEQEDEIWMAASHTWSYPLFYRTTSKETLISDEPGELLIDGQKPEFDSFSKIYFQTFGVTPLAKTLIKDIFQIQPGEIVRIKNKKVETTSFLLYSKNDRTKEHVSENELRELLLSTFEKYFDFVKDRQVLLPLTRGYDSRLLACLLKEFGHDNVICATWGRKNNSEVQTAQKVAGQLGYEHMFIEYNNELITGFSKTEQFLNYANYAGHFSSMPFLQDYFAVNALKENRIIDKSAVAMPGHPGDFLRGSHLFSSINSYELDELSSTIIKKFGNSTPIRRDHRNELKKFIIDNFLNDTNCGNQTGFEHWDFEERQCKFIANSSLVYSFFGLDFIMPLFDRKLFDYFKSVPFNEKLNAAHYYTVLEKLFFIPNNVDFDLKSDKIEEPKGLNNLKEEFLRLCPHVIKKLYYPSNDAIFYKEITTELRNSDERMNFKHPDKPHFYNSYIIQWYWQYLHKNS